MNKKQVILKALCVLFIVGAFFGSCARNNTYAVLNSTQLQTLQALPETDGEKMIEVSTQTSLVTTSKTDLRTKEISNYAARKNYTPTKNFGAKKLISIVKKSTASVIENNFSLAMQSAAMGTSATQERGFKAVGLIFLFFGLVALIPPLVFSAASFLYVIAGILIAIGAIFLLTGLARSAEK